jgi:hypothetical protein
LVMRIGWMLCVWSCGCGLKHLDAPFNVNGLA